MISYQGRQSATLKTYRKDSFKLGIEQINKTNDCMIHHNLYAVLYIALKMQLV